MKKAANMATILPMGHVITVVYITKLKAFGIQVEALEHGESRQHVHEFSPGTSNCCCLHHKAKPLLWDAGRPL